MIGTSLSEQNPKLMLFPSISVCRYPGIAHYKDGDVLESGTLHSEKFLPRSKNTTNTTDPILLEIIPDLSDFLAQLNMKYGSYNMKHLHVDHTDAKLKSYLNGHYALVTDVMNHKKDRFDVCHTNNQT